MIKPVFTTVEQRLILRKLGVLQPTDLVALRSALEQIESVLGDLEQRAAIVEGKSSRKA